MSKWPLVTSILLLGAFAGTAEAQSFITVDTTADVVLRNGLCSLREAIIASNLNQSGDTLSAECSGSGVNDSIRFRAGANPVITLGSALPVITEQVNIIGPAARVVLNGPGSGVGIDISTTAPGTVVSRLVLQDFGAGIRVQGANAVITGNYIGTDAAGTAAVPNTTGISVLADGARIGGTAGVTPGGACTGDCNLISGAGVDGIHINTVLSTHTLIQGNLIGTNASGTAALGNPSGIRLTAAAGATIGGTTAAASNLISGNVRGISFEVSLDAAGSSILGNRIGTNAGGTAAVPNGVGIYVWLFDKAYPVVIGGTAPGTGNVISGNADAGIRLDTADGVLIQGNRIGTLADGTTPLGNGTFGVEVINTALLNVIGGVDAGAGNVIAWNAAGIRVGLNSFGNTILRNSIHDNLGEGIQLDDAQVGTAQPPSIAGLNPVTGLGCPSCWIDVYSDTAGEGRTWHGTVLSDGAGNFLFAGAVDGPYVTATATSINASTSEFSDPFLEDSDGDARADLDDNCTLVVNVDQLDVDADGYGNLCDADLDNSGLTTANDFNLLRSVLNLLAASGPLAAAADMNGSGMVTAADYNLLRALINTAPGPSGLACAGTPPCP